LVKEEKAKKKENQRLGPRIEFRKKGCKVTLRDFRNGKRTRALSKKCQVGEEARGEREPK